MHQQHGWLGGEATTGKAQRAAGSWTHNSANTKRLWRGCRKCAAEPAYASPGHDDVLEMQGTRAAAARPWHTSRQGTDRCCCPTATAPPMTSDKGAIKHKIMNRCRQEHWDKAFAQRRAHWHNRAHVSAEVMRPSVSGTAPCKASRAQARTASPRLTPLPGPQPHDDARRHVWRQGPSVLRSASAICWSRRHFSFRVPSDNTPRPQPRDRCACRSLPVPIGTDSLPRHTKPVWSPVITCWKQRAASSRG